MPAALVLPVSRDGDDLYEMEEGDLIQLPAMSAKASDMTLRLFLQLHYHVLEQKLGRVFHEFMFVINEEHNTRRRPKVAYISNKNLKRHPLPREGGWVITPDLVVEVITPNDFYTNTERKLNEYFLAGVKQVWILNPEQKLCHIYTSRTEVTILVNYTILQGGDLLPGFAQALEQLFC